jgi:hypothetical protein
VISPSQRPLPTQDNTTQKHKRQTSMPSEGFEPATPATEWPQTYALDRAATEVGRSSVLLFKKSYAYKHHTRIASMLREDVKVKRHLASSLQVFTASPSEQHNRQFHCNHKPTCHRQSTVTVWRYVTQNNEERVNQLYRR